SPCSWSSRTRSTPSSSPTAATCWSMAASRSPAPGASCCRCRKSNRPISKADGTDGLDVVLDPRVPQRPALADRFLLRQRVPGLRRGGDRRPRGGGDLAALVERDPVHAAARARGPFHPLLDLPERVPVTALLSRGHGRVLDLRPHRLPPQTRAADGHL